MLTWHATKLNFARTTAVSLLQTVCVILYVHTHLVLHISVISLYSVQGVYTAVLFQTNLGPSRGVLTRLCVERS